MQKRQPGRMATTTSVSFVDLFIHIGQCSLG
jgi:hypothetical protein